MSIVNMPDPFECIEAGQEIGDNLVNSELSEDVEQAVSSTEETVVGSGPRQSLLNYISSGPMSEGHVRLYNNQSRRSDASPNICLFPPCLFLVGAMILCIGIAMYARLKLVLIGTFLVVLGSFSVGSALLYTLVYAIVSAIRHSRESQSSTTGRSKLRNCPVDEPFSNGHVNGGFDQLGSVKEATGVARNDLLENDNEGSTYVPSTSDSVQLNVDSLDLEIKSLKSTQNLDVAEWRTVNAELPQNYLASFGELPSDLLDSPDLKKALDGYNHLNGRHSSKKGKKRGILNSLRNGSQGFSIKANQKSSSQTELLNSEETDGENMLFRIESIQERQIVPGTPQASDSPNFQLEKVTMQTTGPSAGLVVHFNRRNSSGPENTDHVNSLIDTFH